MTQVYKPVFNSTLRSVFEDYIASLKLPSIDYFAIGIQDPINLNSASLMSRVEWQKTFKAMGFPKYDPVRLAMFNSKKSVFYFDEIDHISKIGNEIMLQRKKHEMRNGIVLVDRQFSHNCVLTLATDHRKFKGSDFFSKHRDDLLRVFKDLSLILQPVSSEYIQK